MKKMSPIEQKASSKVLSDLRSHAQSMMSDKMKNLKKVTVASDSKEGLKKGLNKAEEILEDENDSELTQSPLGEKFGKSKINTDLAEDPEEIEGLESDESEESEESEDTEEEESEYANMSEHEIDQKIKEFMALKDKLQKK